MLLGGIQIFVYMAALMHARTMVVDGVWATVGSTNFDNRSFALDEELNLTIYHASLARQLEEAFEQDLKYSKQITYAEWNSRGIGARIYELFAFPVLFSEILYSKKVNPCTVLALSYWRSL